VCDNRTVAVEPGWGEVGERVRESRAAAGLTQAGLADRLGLDRTALAKIESGSRQVSALELFRLADVLGLPVAHFVLRPPPAIVSRRAVVLDEPDSATRSAYYLDADLAAHARDAEWLVDQGLLAVGTALLRSPGRRRVASRPEQAVELARQARAALDRPVEPLGPLAGVCESFGLFVLPVDRDAEGASMSLGEYGVAVIGARREPGRRRWTAAHELGHHLLGDAYHSDVGVAASEQERESVIDAFAGEFLLPAAALDTEWAAGGPDARQRLTRLAGRYRVSWSATVRAAARAGAVTRDEARVLRAETPTRGDFQEALGAEPLPDLVLGETGPAWRAAVLAAWRSGAITAPRVVELLHGDLAESELPRRERPSAEPE
jgi:Zn-dependent peptidase ImmA (M78 family)/transcriptional regulator with XRE-family HTH domain